MNPIPRLGELLGCAPLLEYTDSKRWFTERDEIKTMLADHLKRAPTAHWLSILEPADIWCAEVLDWPKLMAHDGFKTLDMLQRVSRSNGASLATTRCPIRIDGEILKSSVGAPKIGEHNALIEREFEL